MRHDSANAASPSLPGEGIHLWLRRVVLPLLAGFFCTPNPRFTSSHSELYPVLPAPPVTHLAARADSIASPPQPDSIPKNAVLKPAARSLSSDTAPLQSSWTSAFEDKNAQLSAAVSDERCVAVWYGPGFQGKKTASGERFDMNKFTAAHKTLPFNAMVKVTNLDNDLSVVVRINDRGPFNKKYCIDLSSAAAQRIGLYKSGTANVRIETAQ